MTIHNPRLVGRVQAAAVCKARQLQDSADLAVAPVSCNAETEPVSQTLGKIQKVDPPLGVYDLHHGSTRVQKNRGFYFLDPPGGRRSRQLPDQLRARIVFSVVDAGPSRECDGWRPVPATVRCRILGGFSARTHNDVGFGVGGYRNLSKHPLTPKPELISQIQNPCPIGPDCLWSLEAARLPSTAKS